MRIGEQQGEGVRKKERKTTVVTPRELGDREGVVLVEVEEVLRRSGQDAWTRGGEPHP